MKQTSKIFGVLLAVTVVATTVLKADDKPASTSASGGTNAPLGDGGLFPDKVIATGKGVEIKRSRLDEAVSSVRSTAMARGRELTPADLPIIEKSSFDHLLQLQLFSAKANDEDKAAGKKEGDKRMETIRSRAPSEELLARQLKSLNMTVEELHKRLIEEATAEAVLRRQVNVSDDAVKKFYDDNPSKFEEPEKVRAAHILIATGDPRQNTTLSDDEKKAKRKLAEDLLKRAKAGEDFAKLAKENSDDPGSKDNGGEYTFPRGQMVKEFEAAAFSLQTNQISDIVTTAFGYHIIKLLEKFPAKKHEFTEVKGDIKRYLETMEMEKILPDFYAKCKKEADVKILDPQLEALENAPVENTFTPKGASPVAPPDRTAPK